MHPDAGSPIGLTILNTGACLLQSPRHLRRGGKAYRLWWCRHVHARDWLERLPRLRFSMHVLQLFPVDHVREHIKFWPRVHRARLGDAPARNSRHAPSEHDSIRSFECLYAIQCHFSLSPFWPNMSAFKSELFIRLGDLYQVSLSWGQKYERTSTKARNQTCSCCEQNVTA